MIKKIKFEKFTAFENLEIDFSPGINIFIGENGTGKTHILKAIYAACDITKNQKNLAEKIAKIFLPSGEQIGRLIKRSNKSVKGYFVVYRLPIKEEEEKPKSNYIKLTFSNHTKTPDKAAVSGTPNRWMRHPVESVYIPVKDMMANAPGFRSLYSQRHIHFEEVYQDIIDRAFLGALRGPIDENRKKLLAMLQTSMDGKVVCKQEEFFLKNNQGELEFTLLAEGIRKLALLWVLIQNGTLLKGSILLWDEPEANLNPCLMRTVVQILIELQRMGVQIFLATHNYSILKEFDLQANENDQILYHSLFRNKDSGELEVNTVMCFLDISPNAIDDAFGSMIDREIEKSMGKIAK